jgi:NAD(P)-dependent dehydrogenase (short-subunit alcohol dehydrogenase family)
MAKLDGKVAVITGAGSGIGRTIALLFAQQGARVCSADLNLAHAEEDGT